MTSRQPKGVPVGGQFAASEHDEADTPLASSAPFDREAIVADLESRYARAAGDEISAHLARAAEQYGDGGSVRLEFDDVDDRVSIWSPDGEMIEDDSLYDVLPEHLRNGDIVVEREDDGYRITIEDEDGGPDEFHDLKVPRRTVEDLDILARLATERRATIRDAREKLAVIDAFETASYTDGNDSISFEPRVQTLLDGETNTLQVPGSFSIAPGNAWEAQAFAFHGQGVKRVTITREDDGYVIERTVKRPVSGGEEVLVDRVASGEIPQRWTRGEL